MAYACLLCQCWLAVCIGTGKRLSQGYVSRVCLCVIVTSRNPESFLAKLCWAPKILP